MERVEKFICDTKGHKFGHKIVDGFSENHRHWDVCHECHTPNAESQMEIGKNDLNKLRFRITIALHRFAEYYSIILKATGIGIIMLGSLCIICAIVYVLANLAFWIIGKWAYGLLALPIIAYPVGRIFVDQ